MSLGYDLAYTAAAAATCPIWGPRLLRTGKWRTDWRARLARLPVGASAAAAGPTLLIHAVSVGEANAIRLLLPAVARRVPGIRIVVSATTDTGIARARHLYAAEHEVVRFPFDWSGCVRRFLDAVRPDVVALVENEVWPNFMGRCARRGIDVCVINGRLTERSFRRYRLVAPAARRMYGLLQAAAVQTEAYARRFRTLGVSAERVHVFDTMKWDTAEIADHVDGAAGLAATLGIDRSRPLVVAGSTGPGEEQLLLASCPPRAQLLLAPRKPERFDAVARLAPDAMRRTHCPDGAARPPDGRRHFLLDTIGELRKAYALADVVAVGRSFVPDHGGSDPIEPIALGKPTIIGPHHTNFLDTVTALRDGGGILVSDQPGPAIADLLARPDQAAELARRGRQVIAGHQGATERHACLLAERVTEARKMREATKGIAT